ncbi:MAG: hypothetical protein RL494_696 [Bacteroidota bacterium]|jgi:hypothetical protein
MRKLSFFAVIFLLFSCNDKKMLLPLANTTILSEVQDHSPVYIFFKTNKKDTLAEVNRKNTISSTNWIFNIDKRLPLKLVVPEIIKLQEKKSGSAHKNEESQNYYSYSDSVHQNLAFLSFTKVKYAFVKPNAKRGVILFFNKENALSVNNVPVKKENLRTYLASQKSEEYVLCFDKNASYQSYLGNKIWLETIQKSNPGFVFSNEECVF